MAVSRDWNPTRHAAFRDLRLHPAPDLLAQVVEVPDDEGVGCGDGTLSDGRAPWPFTRVFFIPERA